MTSRRTAYIDARLIDPETDYDGPGGVLFENGQILDAGPDVVADRLDEDIELVACAGRALTPGLVDLFAVVDEPGRGGRETLESLSAAASAGGVTTVCVAPDAEPPCDNAAIAELLSRKARDEAEICVHVLGAMTQGRAAKEIAPYSAMAEAGAVGFTDAHAPAPADALMLRLMEYAASCDALLAPVAGSPSIMAGTCATDSELATRRGLVSAPAVAERIGLERDLALAEQTGARYHAAAVTTSGGALAIERAKDSGLAVTAAAPVTHLFFNETDIGDYDSRFRLSPPLRCEADRAALAEALASGVIDALCSGHMPVSAAAKRAPFQEAAPGGATIELLLPAALSLYLDHAVPLIRVIDALTRAPADVINSAAGRLAPGAPADFILIDLDAPFVCAPEGLSSLTKMTPFAGRRLQGRVMKTVSGGELVFDRG